MIQKYHGYNMVISENLTVDVFDMHNDVYVFVAKKYGLSNFMIKEYAEEENEPVIMY